MALVTQRIFRGLFPGLDPNRAPARRDRPERIVLGVQPGHTPSDKPPVRIFLGSERAQFRAERTFLWSVEKQRDPSRIYEIYLLKELRGFSRRFWLTGFTNYRFAIPHFCGFQGRAIYNDADQIYLTDPAELFDLEMGQAGFLSINDRDTSVMLIDCEQMAEAWNTRAAYSGSRKGLEARARARDLWGKLDDGWNARDKEYSVGQSRLVHFTTLHTQPWRPFPEQFVYFPNPTGSLWFDLEDEARSANFMPVSATRPTSRWPDVALALSARPDGPELQALLGPHPPEQRHERLEIRGVLETVPDGDLPWVLDRLFSATDNLQVVLREPLRPGATRHMRSRWFWTQHFREAERRHPATRWQLDRRRGLSRIRLRGGPCPEGPIRVLTHSKPGHSHQALAVARALAERTGREVSETPLPVGPAGFVLRRLLGLSLPAGMRDEAPVLVAAGWLPSRVARRLMVESDGDRRAVLLGRKAGRPSENSVVIGCRHFGLPPHPDRLDCLLPPNAGQAPRVTEAARETCRDWLDSPSRMAVLVGGSSRSHEFSRDQLLRLGRWTREKAEEHDAAILVVTSRRSRPLEESLEEAFGDTARIYRWRANDPANPYGLALEAADWLAVSGESESMLADAVQTGKPVVIWPVPPRQPGPWQRFSIRVARRATRPVMNRRGSIRPQQGRVYLCARALERGWILPCRDLDHMHQVLVEGGLAALPGQPLPAASEGFSETEEITGFIGTRLGLAVEPERTTHSDEEQPTRHVSNH